MIYTVTLNPSLDYIMDVKHFEPGMVNRTTAEKIFAGGKGITYPWCLKILDLTAQHSDFWLGLPAKRLNDVGRKRNFHRLYLLGGRDFPN